MAYDHLMIFAGSANPQLAAAVAKRLNIPLGGISVGRFSDGEVVLFDVKHRVLDRQPHLGELCIRGGLCLVHLRIDPKSLKDR